MVTNLRQIAIRLPPELLKAAEAIAAQRKRDAKRDLRWTEAHTTTRTDIIREAIERGLAAISKQG
jgi:hypothetical protein